jgi:hypothetical protein
MGAGADGAGKLAHGNHFAGGFEPLQRTAKFVVHQRQLQAEGRRFSVDAVAAADHRRELMFLGPGGDRLAQHLDILDEHAGRLHHLHREGGIPHVAAGQAVVQPPVGGRADVLGDVGRESDDVVVKRALKLLAPLNAERGAGLDLPEILPGHQPLGAERFAGEQFDLQPDFQLALFAPDLPHERARVTLNHGPTVKGRGRVVEKGRAAWGAAVSGQ